jgi:DNA-binding response OmpR family regulator
VLTARDGDEAVRIHAAHAAEIDLAVLDVTMPRRTGPEALAAMRACRPDLVAILTSGNFDPRDETQRGPEAEVLAKPYSTDTLARRIHHALERRPEREKRSAG